MKPICRASFKVAGRFLGLLTLVATFAFAAWPVVADDTSEVGATYWWKRYLTFSSSPALAEELHARWTCGAPAGDPTWGPYGQFVTTLGPEDMARYRTLKEAGLRWCAYTEGYGQCQLYAIAFVRREDGALPVHENAPDVAKAERIAWNWEAKELKRGNLFGWVGVHNTVNNEEFAQPRFSMQSLGFPMPMYPDGREAVGWTEGQSYPLNARVYDACCAKDINGELAIELFRMPAQANEADPTTGKPKGDIEGLYPFVPGPNYANYRNRFPDKKEGEPVYAAGVYLHKDIAAPFWAEAVRTTMRQMLEHDVDSMWCDNFSPWDNFSAWPVRTAFGDWSEARFKDFLRERFSDDEIRDMGIDDFASFNVRHHLKEKAVGFGAEDPSYHWDIAWRDTRWLDDPVWNAYKVFKQKVGQEGLQSYYAAVHDEADKAGRPDFCLAGNDTPGCLGWTRGEWLDMASSETGPEWNLLAGSRGFMIPPVGKMAVVYRAILEHQKGPYATSWYYLSPPYDKHRGNPEIGKVLAAEAFANSTFLKFHPNTRHPGTIEGHAWWNKFVLGEEQQFGRRFIAADVGILYSPDNRLALMTPGGVPNFERQPHAFGHWGFATAMIDGHIPYRVVVDWKLKSEFLKPFRSFVIPYAVWMDDATAPMLDEWVRAGGRLVVTGPSGTRAATAGHFKKRTESILASLVGEDMNLRGEAGMERASGKVQYAIQDPFTAITVDDGAGQAASASTPADSDGVVSGDGAPVHTRKVGKGTVIWTPTPMGLDYFVKDKERPSLLPRLLEMVGDSVLLDGKDLPSTVGVFLWQSSDGRTRFADLVNYNLDADADVVRPAENLRFRMRLPDGCGGVQVTTLSPDEAAPATVAVEDGWAVVHLGKLIHYASVKVVAN